MNFIICNLIYMDTISIQWYSLENALRSLWYRYTSLAAIFFDVNLHLFSYSVLYTLNSENFARISFSRIALKDIFATLEIRDLCMI